MGGGRGWTTVRLAGTGVNFGLFSAPLSVRCKSDLDIVAAH